MSLISRGRIRTSLLILAMSLAVTTGAARAEGAWSHEVTYKADVMGPISGGVSPSGRFLDNLDVKGDLDLSKAAGWNG
ncbi:MAG: hypothetical protein Q7T23_06665, partial [Phenylobacterium sp.]|nr:hypothetical protein [Phenylobacterium sp.]